MLSLIRAFSYAHHRRHRMQTLLCLVGIALGVLVVVGMDLANANAMRSFSRGIDVVAGRATHEVTAPSIAFDESAFLKAATTPGILAATPVVDGYVRVLDVQPPLTLEVLGVDPLTDLAFRDFAPRNAGGSDQEDRDRFLRFLTEPDTIVISARLAARLGKAAGDTLTVELATSTRRLAIVGTFEEQGTATGSSEQIAAVDIATAQELFDSVGRITRIDLMIAPDERRDAVLAELRSRLGPGLTVEEPATRAGRVEAMIASFRLNLTALSLLALTVGMFLIYNTMMFSVVQRKRDIAICRALGMTRVQTLGLILAEAAIFGAVGALLGILGGRAITDLLLTGIASTISDLYAYVRPEPPVMTWDTPLKGLLLGVAASVGAALWPAWEASTVAPSLAMKSSPAPRMAERLIGVATASAVVFGVGALALLAIPGRSPVPGFGAAFAVAVAFALLVPLATEGVRRLLTPVRAHGIGPVRLLATRNLAQALTRTGVATAALLVALSMVIGVRMMIASFRESLNDWVGQQIRADVYIAPAGAGAGGRRFQATLEPEFLAALETLPGVARVDRLRGQEITFGDRLIRLSAVEASVLGPAAEFTFLSGRRAEDVWGELRAGAVIISEPLASLTGLAAGGAIELQTPSGPRSFPVAEVYRDYSSSNGALLMDLSTYRPLWRDDSINNAALYAKPGTDAEDLARAVLDGPGAGRLIVVRTNERLRTEINVIFDRTFSNTLAMEFLAALVAICGVISALLAILLERTRELGILRALGMTIRQLTATTLAEAALMGAIASALAAVAGTLLALILVHHINLRSFGWTIGFEFQPWVPLAAGLVAVVVATLGAAAPIWRIRRMDPMKALRDE